MGILVSCQTISKSYSSRPLFKDISFGIEDRERVSVISVQSGTGKSTLLKILAGEVEPDTGAVVSRRAAAYLVFDPGAILWARLQRLRMVVTAAAAEVEFEDYERAASVDSTLAEIGFPDRNAPAGSLSGGWRKRLAVAVCPGAAT